MIEQREGVADPGRERLLNEVRNGVEIWSTTAKKKGRWD